MKKSRTTSKNSKAQKAMDWTDKMSYRANVQLNCPKKKKNKNVQKSMKIMKHFKI